MTLTKTSDGPPLVCTGQWSAWDWIARAFIPEGEPVSLSARMTPKTIFVTLPSGSEERLPRFDRSEQPRTEWRRYFDGFGGTRKFIDFRITARPPGDGAECAPNATAAGEP